jgi:hypothetical protein
MTSPGPGEVERELTGWLLERGLGDVRPRRLREAGNLLVLLDPLPVVARIGVLEPGDDPAEEAAVATRELAVARYLADRGCPVVAPADRMDAGPYRLRGAVMTLWTYVREQPRPFLGLRPLVDRVRELDGLLAIYPEPLPRLGAWWRNGVPLERLTGSGWAGDVGALGALWEAASSWMQQSPLVPQHGDPHRANLLYDGRDWRWIDFEDVSLLPPWWDVATAAAATVRRGGARVLGSLVDAVGAGPDAAAFLWTLFARETWAVTQSLYLASRGLTGRAAAERQWQRLRELAAAILGGGFGG